MSILDPIASENRCGNDFKYGDQSLSVEIEIEKAFNATNEEEIDWDFIIGNSEDILVKNSKDLKIASYWLYSQWRKNGWSNFFHYLDMLTMLVVSFGKDLHPAKSTRKIKIFEWLESVFEKPFLDILDKLSEEELKRLKEILDKLNEGISKCVEEEINIFREVHRGIVGLIEGVSRREEERAKERQQQQEEERRRQLEAACEQEAKDMRRSEEKEILDKLAATRAAENIDTENIEKLTYESLEIIIDPMLEQIQKMIDIAPTDYFAIKPLFSLGEMIIEKALLDTEIVRDDFIPSVDVCNASRAILNHGTISIQQLTALEEQLIIRPTWMEGYYILSQLLYKFNKIQDAKSLEELIIHLIYRKKELLDFVVDERTFIEGDMLIWVKERLTIFGDSDEANVKYKTSYQKALSIKDEKGVDNALLFLEKNYKNSSSEEERFRWRLVFSEFALAIGNRKLALSLLLELEKIIERYSLDKWQPELAIETYEILLKPVMIQELGNDNKERIYQKLSILDLQKIINLQ